MASKTSFDAMFSGWAAQTVAATEAPACLLKRKQRFAAGNDIKGGNQDVEPNISIRQRFRATLTERDGGMLSPSDPQHGGEKSSPCTQPRRGRRDESAPQATSGSDRPRPTPAGSGKSGMNCRVAVANESA